MKKTANPVQQLLILALLKQKAEFEEVKSVLENLLYLACIAEVTHAEKLEKPVKYTDPTGLSSALVNFRDMAGGQGHSSSFVQNDKGEWIAGDFGGQNLDSKGHVEGIFNGEDTGRFWLTNTGTTDLNDAIKIIAKKFGNDPDNIKALEFTTDTKADKKILNEMIKYDKMYNPAKYGITDKTAKDAPSYRLVGNSCLDASVNIISAGGVILPMHLIQPNLTYDTKFNSFEVFKNNLIGNFFKLFTGDKQLTGKDYDFTPQIKDKNK